MRKTLLFLLTLALCSSVTMAQTRAANALNIYVVDVEGGNAVLFVELRARHSCLADDVVELAVSQIRTVRVGQFDLLAIVDPVVVVIAVVIWNPSEVPPDEVIVDL